jgi:hypothetical protein
MYGFTRIAMILGLITTVYVMSPSPGPDMLASKSEPAEPRAVASATRQDTAQRAPARPTEAPPLRVAQPARLAAGDCTRDPIACKLVPPPVPPKARDVFDPATTGSTGRISKAASPAGAASAPTAATAVIVPNPPTRPPGFVKMERKDPQAPAAVPLN